MTAKKLLLALLAICFNFLYSNANNPQIINGIIDLTEVDWNDNLIKFEGNADFYWKEFVMPDSTNDELVEFKKYAAPLPKTWTKVELEEGAFAPNQGYASYRIRIKVPNTSQVYGLKLRSIFTAYKLYVNGKLITSLGKVGTSKEESKPAFLTREIPIAVTQKEGIKYQTLDMVMHVSNFHHRRAGAQQAMKFGTMEEVVDETNDVIILNLFLIGIILIIGLNHVLMYALRRLDIANLTFGFLSIIMILRNISTEERLLLHWFPNLDWEMIVRFDNFSGFATMSLFGLFFYSAFRKDFPKVMFYILTVIGVLITILVFSTEALFYGKFHLVMEAYIGLGGLYLTFGVLMFAAFRKRPGALLSFIGMFLLYTTAIHDVLNSMGIFNSPFIAPYGIAAFMVLQSFLLTKKSALALLDNQKLSIELNQEKQLLEQNIEERTVELTKQADELKLYQQEQEQQNWINEGLNLVIEVMRKNKDNVSQLADQLLSTLVKRIDATLGAMYLHTNIDNQDQLKLIAQYGLKDDSQLEYIGIQEGLTGQCFSLSKEKFIEELPDKYFDISSGLGSSNPKLLALLPLKIDELTIGVVEIGTFKKLNETQKEFLRRANENIASQLNIVKMNEESQTLIEESKKLEHEALAKNREMRETLEEMQAIQEEDEGKDLEYKKLLEVSKKREDEIKAELNESYKKQKELEAKLKEISKKHTTTRKKKS